MHYRQRIRKHPQDVLLLQQPPRSHEGHLLAWQVHEPLEHCRLFVQACPHEPQLLLSLCSFTHVPLHEL